MAKARKRTESASNTDQPEEQQQSSPEPSADSFSASGEGYDHGEYRDRVAMRAYELYLARGGGDGGDFEDWLAAEREVGGNNGNASRGDAGE